MLNGNHLFRQFHERSVLAVLPVRMDAGDHILNGSFHLEVNQVLAVHDFNSVVCASVTVQEGCVHIPLVLPAVGVQHGTVHAAKAAAHCRRAGDREDSRAIDVRPEFKRAIRSHVAFERSHRRLGALRRERRNRDEVLLILDVPCLYLQKTSQRSCDLIDPKGLCSRPLRRLCKDDVALHHVLRMDAERWIFHFQLIGSVPLFHHIA